MPASLKDGPDVLTPGTRVRPAYDKLSTRRGTILDRDAAGFYTLRWDDQSYPQHGFIRGELTPFAHLGGTP